MEIGSTSYSGQIQGGSVQKGCLFCSCSLRKSRENYFLSVLKGCQKTLILEEIAAKSNCYLKYLQILSKVTQQLGAIE